MSFFDRFRMDPWPALVKAEDRAEGWLKLFIEEEEWARTLYEDRESANLRRKKHHAALEALLEEHRALQRAHLRLRRRRAPPTGPIVTPGSMLDMAQTHLRQLKATNVETERARSALEAENARFKEILYLDTPNAHARRVEFLKTSLEWRASLRALPPAPSPETPGSDSHTAPSPAPASSKASRPRGSRSSASAKPRTTAQGRKKSKPPAPRKRVRIW